MTLVVALLLVPAARPVPAHAATAATLVQIIQEEANYIYSMWTGTVIATNPARDTVVPYHANYAAIGLAKAYQIVHDSKYATVAWRWLHWYADHMRADGTISDYVYSGDWIPKGLPDSTDSYAGTYLSAMLAVFEGTGDVQNLQSLHAAIGKALGAIELTEDPLDGLHFARPGWPFKYSMDEAEAYAGFKAAETLGQVLNDATLQARAHNDAAKLRLAATHLIDQTTGYYLWAVDDHSAPTPAPIQWIYPGASAQMWAVEAGFATGATAQSLVDAVDRAQPNWDAPRGATQWSPGHCGPTATTCSDFVYYWPRFALAHLAIGDTSRALTSGMHIRNAAIADNRRLPFTPGDSGQLIMLFGDADVMLTTVGYFGLPPTPL